MRDEPGDGLSDHFLFSVAKESLSALVPAGDHTIEILADDGIVGGRNDGRQKHAGALRVFQSPAFAQIHRDRQCRDNMIDLVLNWEEGDRHVGETPVPIDAPCLIVLGSFPVANPLKNLALIGTIVRGNDQGEVPAENFVSTVSEHSFRCGIPGSHKPIQVARDDRFFGKFANSSKFQTRKRLAAVVLRHECSSWGILIGYMRLPHVGYPWHPWRPNRF